MIRKITCLILVLLFCVPVLSQQKNKRQPSFRSALRKPVSRKTAVRPGRPAPVKTYSTPLNPGNAETARCFPGWKFLRHSVADLFFWDENILHFQVALRKQVLIDGTEMIPAREGHRYQIIIKCSGKGSVIAGLKLLNKTTNGWERVSKLIKINSETVTEIDSGELLVKYLYPIKLCHNDKKCVQPRVKGVIPSLIFSPGSDLVIYSIRLIPLAPVELKKPQWKM